MAETYRGRVELEKFSRELRHLLLRKRREDPSYTLTWVDEKIGRQPGYVSAISKGKRQPSEFIIRAITEALGYEGEADRLIALVPQVSGRDIRPGRPPVTTPRGEDHGARHVRASDARTPRNPASSADTAVASTVFDVWVFEYRGTGSEIPQIEVYRTNAGFSRVRVVPGSSPRPFTVEVISMKGEPYPTLTVHRGMKSCEFLVKDSEFEIYIEVDGDNPGGPVRRRLGKVST